MKTLNEKLDQIARELGRRAQGDAAWLAGWAQLSPRRVESSLAGQGIVWPGCADEQQLILITVICAAVHNDA